MLYWGYNKDVKIVWDEPKRLYNIEKHGLDFAMVTDAIFDANIVQEADRGRLKAIGYLNGIAVAMIFQVLGTEAIAVISLRPAGKKERSVL